MNTETTTTTRTYGKRHEDDRWVDEIRIEEPSGPLLRLVTVERWKESELSGDEWRFGVVWEHLMGDNPIMVEGFSAHKIDSGVLRLYPLVTTLRELPPAFPAMLETPVTVHFYRKGYLLWNVPEVRTLRDAAGNLPWDLIVGGERHDAVPAEEATKHLCFQPGCREVGTVKYLIKQDYDHRGNKQDSYGRQTHRLFCEKHTHRGDCGLEDSDSNYELAGSDA